MISWIASLGRGSVRQGAVSGAGLFMCVGVVVVRGGFSLECARTRFLLERAKGTVGEKAMIRSCVEDCRSQKAPACNMCPRSARARHPHSFKCNLRHWLSRAMSARSSLARLPTWREPHTGVRSSRRREERVQDRDLARRRWRVRALPQGDRGPSP